MLRRSINDSIASMPRQVSKAMARHSSRRGEEADGGTFWTGNPPPQRRVAQVKMFTNYLNKSNTF